MFGGTWETSAAVALFATLTLTPVMRRVALATGIVDQPAARKIHTSPVPYLGGAAIAVGVLAGLAVGPTATWRLAIVAAAGLAVGVVGVLDDRTPLRAMPRIAVQVCAALAAVGAGVSVDVAGVAVLDAAITVFVIVAVTNAYNLLDNMDGLSAGVALASSVGIAIAAQLNGQYVLAALGASVAAAAWGFLAYNLTPASIFMGDAGALFLGFCIAVAAIELDPVHLSRPEALVVTSLVLAVPAADTTTVVVSRIRRGVSIMTAGRDHLSHRLVARGFTQLEAVGILCGTQAVAAVVTVALHGRAWTASIFVLTVVAVVLGRAVGRSRHPRSMLPSGRSDELRVVVDSTS